MLPQGRSRSLWSCLAEPLLCASALVREQRAASASVGTLQACSLGLWLCCGALRPAATHPTHPTGRSESLSGLFPLGTLAGAAIGHKLRPQIELQPSHRFAWALHSPDTAATCNMECL